MTTRLKSLLIGSGALLLVPFIGSQFSQEINWYGFDYMVGAILLVGTSFVFEFVLAKAKNKQKSLGMGHRSGARFSIGLDGNSRWYIWQSFGG